MKVVEMVLVSTVKNSPMNTLRISALAHNAGFMPV